HIQSWRRFANPILLQDRSLGRGQRFPSVVRGARTRSQSDQGRFVSHARRRVLRSPQFFARAQQLHRAGRLRHSSARLLQRLGPRVLWALRSARRKVREIRSGGAGRNLPEKSASSGARLRLRLLVASGTRHSYACAAQINATWTYLFRANTRGAETLRRSATEAAQSHELIVRRRYALIPGEDRLSILPKQVRSKDHARMKLWAWDEKNLPSITHAIRTAVAATVSVIVARLVQMPEAYWAAIATLVVMQSTLGATLTLSIERIVATAVGASVGALEAN